VLYLLGSLVWVPAVEVAVGVVVFPLVAIYVYGVTALITGLSPNELLFDTPRFLAFGVALGVVAVPLVVAALVHTESPTLANGVAIGVAVLAALAGLLLARRASRQWADRSADP
jgi:amino acid permease